MTDQNAEEFVEECHCLYLGDCKKCEPKVVRRQEKIIGSVSVPEMRLRKKMKDASEAAGIVNVDCKRHGTPFCCSDANADLIGRVDDALRAAHEKGIEKGKSEAYLDCANTHADTCSQGKDCPDVSLFKARSKAHLATPGSKEEPK